MALQKITSEQIQQKLEQNFGFSELRGLQKHTLEALIQGKSVLTVMPTGTGKSLCYQLPALFADGVILVISPLIALMQDQVQKAKSFGIQAAALNSSMSAKEREAVLKKVAESQVKLLFVTPERFQKPEFISTLESVEIEFFAIDEAHCISQWGHDFRPDFTRIKDFIKHFKVDQVLALTATATAQTRKDIIEQLNTGPEFLELVGGFERENLDLNVLEVSGVEQKIQALYMYRTQIKGPMIIYFSLVQTLEKVSQALQKLGVEHLTYHGQMKDHLRSKNLKNFISSESPLMLATPAFGLGVDKSDIRSVIHAEIPGSIEAYYQEVGRGGRDGKPCHCHLLLDDDDLAIQMDFIKWSNPEPEFIKYLFRLLEQNQKKYEMEGLDFLRSQMNFYNSRDFRVETALNLLQRWESVEYKGNYKMLKIIEEPKSLYLDEELYQAKLKQQNKKLYHLFQLLKKPKEELMPSILNYFEGDESE